MGNRLSKIVTRTGDDGSTGLADGRRLAKDDARIEAIGDIDELNSVIGLLRAELSPDSPLQVMLERIQHDLFDLGGELSLPGHLLLKDDALERLDTWLAELNATLPPLKEFILPTGSRATGTCHVARTVCRRAERHTLSLHRAEPMNANALPYLNRLSDLLFVMARTLGLSESDKEHLWDHRR